MEDQEIIDLYFQRKEQAIHETAKKYGRYCSEIAFRILQNTSDSEECVNDAYLQLWKAIPPARPAVLRTYLGRVMRNIAINRYRSNHRKCRNQELEVSIDELADCIPSGEDSEYNRDMLDLGKIFDQFIRTLEPLDRQLFVGRYWHSYRVAEMAEHCGLSADAVSSRLWRVRARLRVYLEERGVQV